MKDVGERASSARGGGVGGRERQEGGREGPLSALAAVARVGCVGTFPPYLWPSPAALEVRGGARGQVLGELPAALLSVALDVAAEWLQVLRSVLKISNTLATH